MQQKMTWPIHRFVSRRTCSGQNLLLIDLIVVISARSASANNTNEYVNVIAYSWDTSDVGLVGVPTSKRGISHHKLTAESLGYCLSCDHTLIREGCFRPRKRAFET